MKIEIVQLENIRSHVKSTVPFTGGFNCLLGGVGCGKSSVLYAVDFVLFGESRTYDYLLREGADWGRVTVQFTHNSNTYKLTRGLRRKGKSITQNIEDLKLWEDERLIASMKIDAVAEQVKAITGLDCDLYREIVWFKQEHLKELLDAKPRDRQTRLDELFGLSDYEVAWSNIALYQRDYERELGFYQKEPDVLGLERLSEDYGRASEEYTLLELELETTAQKLMIAKKTLEESDGKLKRMEERKQFIEELKRKEARLQSDIRNIANNISSKTQETKDKKTLIGNLQQRQNQFETQIKQCLIKLEQAGLPTNQPIEVMRSALAAFDDKINSLHADQETTSRNLITDKKRAGELLKESKCPLCVQPLEGEYKSNLLSRIEHENCEREKSISKLRIEIDSLRKTKTLASDAYSNLQTYLTKVEDCKNRIKEEEENLNIISLDFLEKQRLEDELGLQLDSVLYEIGNFDVSELEMARNQEKQAQQQFYFLDSELRTKQNRKADLFRRLDDTKERINLAQEKLERMEKIRRTIEMLGAIRDAYRSIQPRLRSEFVKVLRNFVQQVLDGLVGGEAQMLNVVIDETYTPYVKSESGVDREVSNLSGGERTLLAFAYRLGLGQLIMQSRTGHGLSMLVLDEPTENLGSEDGSIERLAEAISRFKAIEQIIAVTHSEAFANKADHVVTLEKEAGTSKISMQR